MSDMHVEITRDYNFPASAVWGVLGNFGDLSWADNPPVEVIGSGPGMIRRLRMPGLAPIDEQLESLDNANRTLAYTIPRGLPMPVKDYRAVIRVEDTGAGTSRVRWNATAVPDGVSAEQAAQIIEGAYGQMLGWLNDRLARG
jgi:hypothetical protein